VIHVVTGFVPIPDHPRSELEYRALGQQLIDTGVSLFQASGSLNSCWLQQLFNRNAAAMPELQHAVADNPCKNTIAYHVVQAQKIEWMRGVLRKHPDKVSIDDVLCWIDYAIFHVPGVTAKVIRKFLKRAKHEQSIVIPGCWNQQKDFDDLQVNWRFCGGVAIVPVRLVEAFDIAVKCEYLRLIREKRLLTWEVNVWANVEQRVPDLPIYQYRADHDDRLFTAYRAMEGGDGFQTQAVRGFEARSH
jgi:hypothetical protein